jgi:hypothetical protein
VASFLVWNLSGMYIGYQNYRPDMPKTRQNDEKYGRYHTYIADQFKVKHHAVWGLESYRYRDDVLCFTEGVFDACRLHNHGIPAVAVFSNNPKPLKPWLRILPKPRRLIGVRDNDDAGKHFKSIFDECYMMEAKDLGDSTEDEVADMVRKILEETK